MILRKDPLRHQRRGHRDREELGNLAQLRDLLPGRYAFGLTGRDAEGETLEPGRYRLELTAYPTGPGQPTRASLTFTIR